MKIKEKIDMSFMIDFKYKSDNWNNKKLEKMIVKNKEKISIIIKRKFFILNDNLFSLIEIFS